MSEAILSVRHLSKTFGDHNVLRDVSFDASKGDVISMPKGATPLDFAYRIHSGVGNKCVGAKVNGRIVPLDTELQTGDRVEIMTSASSKGPSTDWLRICRTPQAKAKIRQFLKKELREENIELGRSMVERECKRRNVNMADLLKPEYYDCILKKYGFQELDDIFGAVGYGGMASVYVVSRLVDEQRAHEPAPAPKMEPAPDAQHRRPVKANHGIIMVGNEDMDIPVRFAKCCSPVPGDDIVGYITRGRGVTIHKAECVNALSGEAERRVDVAWAETNLGSFCAAIKIVGYDHVGMLGEIATYIGDLGVFIRNSTSGCDKNKIATIKLVLEVHSREQMDSVIRQLRRRSDVIDVYRVNG